MMDPLYPLLVAYVGAPMLIGGIAQLLGGHWLWAAIGLVTFIPTVATLRIAAGVPPVGVDTDPKTLPHELGMIGPAVHLAKGCYRGQETVARLHNMGRPPRRLILAHFDGALPDPGAQIVRGERVVGRVGSVAHHYELGPIGLALVKRSIPLDEQLSAGGIALSQEQIVTADL